MQEVSGSIPLTSTKSSRAEVALFRMQDVWIKKVFSPLRLEA